MVEMSYFCEVINRWEYSETNFQPEPMPGLLQPRKYCEQELTLHSTRLQTQVKMRSNDNYYTAVSQLMWTAT